MRQEFAANRAVFGVQERRSAPPREPTWEEEVAERKLRSDIAWLRFELAMLQLWMQRKAGFKEDQPRVPPGHGRESGRWTAGPGTGPGIGHNRPPFEKPPNIPKEAPATPQERTAIARQVARWLVRRTPVGLAAILAGTGATWLYNQYSAHIEAYRDPPKSFEELQEAAAAPRHGYDRHHVVERTSATQDGYLSSQVEDPSNLVSIPRMKHWEITGWYNTRNKQFGGLSPRDYLRDKPWEERREIGLFALRKFGVLKP